MLDGELAGVVVMVCVVVEGGTETVIVIGGGVLVAVTVTISVWGGSARTGANDSGVLRVVIGDSVWIEGPGGANVTIDV